jgi:hypothetical protein
MKFPTNTDGRLGAARRMETRAVVYLAFQRMRVAQNQTTRKPA